MPHLGWDRRVAVKVLCLLAVAGLVVAMPAGAGGEAAARSTASPPTLADARDAEYVAGELLVRFHVGVGAAERAGVARQAGGRVEKRPPGDGAFVVQLPAGESVAEAAAAFESRPEVLYAE